jgi:hypothetical protein
MNLTFIWQCIASMFLKYNQQDATFYRSIYFYKFLYMFQAVSPPIIRSTKLFIQRHVLSNSYCCLLLSWMRWNCERSSISSMIAAGSSIGLTIRDAVWTVLCSWWWAEEPPEICRDIYRNKQIEKTLHHFGCTLEIYYNECCVTMLLWQIYANYTYQFLKKIVFQLFCTLSQVTYEGRIETKECSFLHNLF